MFRVKSSRFFCLLLVFLLTVSLLPGCASSGIDMDLPTLTPELEADILTAQAKYYKTHPASYSLSIQFCNLDTKEDGLRYYGSFENTNEIEIHVLFATCDLYNYPTSVKYRGNIFTHPSSFIFYIFAKRDGQVYFSPLGNLFDVEEEVTQEQLAQFAEVHYAYEKMIYGSATNVDTVETEEEIIRDYKAYTLARSGSAPSESASYDIYEGYLIFWNNYFLSVRTDFEIGGERFIMGTGSNLFAYRDGTVYSLAELFEEGKISQEAISAYAQLHRERYPQYYD